MDERTEVANRRAYEVRRVTWVPSQGHRRTVFGMPDPQTASCWSTITSAGWMMRGSPASLTVGSRGRPPRRMSDPVTFRTAGDPTHAGTSWTESAASSSTWVVCEIGRRDREIRPRFPHGDRRRGPIADPQVLAESTVLCVEHYRNRVQNRVSQSESRCVGTHSPDNPSIAVSHVVRQNAGQPQD